MTQQEIKENILPHLPLSIDYDNDLISVDGNMVLECFTPTKDAQIALPKAVLSAIENTYGKGINPESVPGMYNALNVVHRYLKDIGSNETANTIQLILNKAIL